MPTTHGLPFPPSGVTIDGTEVLWMDKEISGDWFTYQFTVAEVLASFGAGFSGGTLTSALNAAPTVTIASSSTPAIGAALSNFISITGTTSITGFDSIADGAERIVTFTGVLTLTYNATSLILPGAANITTAAGDVGAFKSLGSGDWLCVAYLKADGTAIVGGAGGLSDFTDVLNTSTPNATVTVAALTVTGAATDMDFALVPKGAGSLLAAIPNNSATGGNKRGANAVDFQLVRTVNTMVAAGALSVIVGGSNNSIAASYYAYSAGAIVAGNANSIDSGGFCFIGAGSTNTMTGHGGANAIVGGTTNAIGSGGNGGYNFIGGGSNNSVLANSSYSTLSGGYGNSINGNWGTIAGGESNTASADFASVTGGISCTSDGIAARTGGYGAIARGVTGMDNWSSMMRAVPGDTQRESCVLRGTTIDDTTPVQLTIDVPPATTTNIPALATGTGQKIRGQILARSAAGDCAGWDFSALLKNVSGTVSLVGAAIVTLVATDTSLATCTVTITADNTNKGPAITVTGVAATTIYWVVDFFAAAGGR